MEISNPGAQGQKSIGKSNKKEGYSRKKQGWRSQGDIHRILSKVILRGGSYFVTKNVAI